MIVHSKCIDFGISTDWIVETQSERGFDVCPYLAERTTPPKIQLNSVFLFLVEETLARSHQEFSRR